MATHDVPGANPVNNDDLKMGCWAEHADGSLIFVESTEGNRVIYSMFDISKTPPIEYRDAMPLTSFYSTFSWKKTDNDIKWTWHDKTPFPWDRIIKSGISDGPRFPSAQSLMAAAEAVARKLKLHGSQVSKDVQDRATDHNPITSDQIMQRLRKAIDVFFS